MDKKKLAKDVIATAAFLILIPLSFWYLNKISGPSRPIGKFTSSEIAVKSKPVLEKLEDKVKERYFKAIVKDKIYIFPGGPNWEEGLKFNIIPYTINGVSYIIHISREEIKLGPEINGVIAPRMNIPILTVYKSKQYHPKSDRFSLTKKDLENNQLINKENILGKENLEMKLDNSLVLRMDKMFFGSWGDGVGEITIGRYHER